MTGGITEEDWHRQCFNLMYVQDGTGFGFSPSEVDRLEVARAVHLLRLLQDALLERERQLKS